MSLKTTNRKAQLIKLKETKIAEKPKININVHHFCFLFLHTKNEIHLTPKTDSKLGLKLLNNGLINLESLSKYVVPDLRIRPENLIRHRYNSRVLAAQPRKRNGASVPHVSLIMNQSHRKHENVSFLQDFAYQLVVRVGCDEPGLNAALKNGENLGGAWMRVGWDNAPCGVVYSSKGDPEGVEPGQLTDCHGRNF